jgi:chromosome segregation ATPase
MDANILAAIISAAGSAAVAITALVLNHRGFAAVDSRFASLDSRFASLDSRFASLDSRMTTLENRMTTMETRLDNRMTTMENRLDRRLETIGADLKEFFRVLAEHDKRTQRLEDKQ